MARERSNERDTRPRREERGGNTRGQTNNRERESRPKARASSSSKSKFQYKERTYESINRRAERQGGGFESPFLPAFDMWRAKPGDNYIRILPQTWDDPDNYFGFKVWVHAWVGADNATYCCPRKMNDDPCPICEAAEEAKSHGDDDKEIKGLKPVEKYVYWIIDRDDDNSPPKPKLYMVGWMQDRDLAAALVDKKTKKSLAIDNPYNGFDVTIKRTGLMLQTRYQSVIDRETTALAKKDSVIDEILDYVQNNPIPSTLKFCSEEHLEKAISGTNSERDDDLDDNETDDDREAESENEGREARADKKANKPPARRASRRDDPEDEPEGVPEDDPEGKEYGEEEAPEDEPEYEEEGEEQADEGGEEGEGEESDPPPRERSRGASRREEAPRERTREGKNHGPAGTLSTARTKERERGRDPGPSGAVSSGRRQFRD